MKFEDWLNRKEKPKEKKIYRLKRSPINPVSKKQKERLSRYNEAKKNHYKSNNFCDICLTEQNLTIHHISGRGKNIDKNLVTLCMDCHTYVHKNPKWSRENGYLI